MFSSMKPPRTKMKPYCCDATSLQDICFCLSSTIHHPPSTAPELGPSESAPSVHILGNTGSLLELDHTRIRPLGLQRSINAMGSFHLVVIVFAAISDPTSKETQSIAELVHKPCPYSDNSISPEKSRK